MNWKALLGTGAYFAFFMLSVFAILWWQRRQRKSRLPFGDGLRLLRGPGETQRKLSRDMEEQELFLVAVVGGMPVLIAATMLQWTTGIPGVLQWPWLVLVLLVFIATYLIAARWFAKRVREGVNRYLGYFGERIVAEHLEPLKQDGWRVFHDVPGQNNGAEFNLDHVAVGPGGVWVIETKTRRKGSARPGFDDHKVYFDGRELVWPWGEDSHGLAQAERSAIWLGIPCIGLNGGDMFKHSEAFSFQIATDNQKETDKYWNAIVKNGGQESQCGWCKDRWGISWQITPCALTEAMAAGGAEAKRAFAAMMEMGKIDVAKIEAARRGA